MLLFLLTQPSGQVSLVVAMSMSMSTCGPSPCNLFQGLSLALTSRGQFKASHWSNPPHTPELVWMGLMDCLSVGGVQLVDCPRMEP